MSSKLETGVRKRIVFAAENRRMLLRRWAAKARCSRTQKTAYRLWNSLRQWLTRAEANALLIAWAHAEGDEGPRELDGLVVKFAGSGRPAR